MQDKCLSTHSLILHATLTKPSWNDTTSLTVHICETDILLYIIITVRTHGKNLRDDPVGCEKCYIL